MKNPYLQDDNATLKNKLGIAHDPEFVSCSAAPGTHILRDDRILLRDHSEGAPHGGNR
jgi:hypothetical protein